jgi:hypothetical protein
MTITTDTQTEGLVWSPRYRQYVPADLADKDLHWDAEQLQWVPAESTESKPKPAKRATKSTKKVSKTAARKR